MDNFSDETHICECKMEKKEKKKLESSPWIYKGFTWLIKMAAFFEIMVCFLYQYHMQRVLMKKHRRPFYAMKGAFSKNHLSDLCG